MKTLVGHLENATTQPAPRIECYLPADPPVGGGGGVGLVILPGGGYCVLAGHEGQGYGDFFARNGVACFVVTYRLAPQGFHHPAMLEDALAAMATVREHAGEFGVNPARIGIMGSSAGGHLAAHALIAYNTYTGSIPLRPDFGVLCYPVITQQAEYAHTGTRDNLLGVDQSPARLRAVSCEQQVTAQTPPCFIWHTCEDSCVPVENSLCFAGALRQHGVPFELHIYDKGGHGLGLNAPYPWGMECLRWMRGLTVAANATVA